MPPGEAALGAISRLAELLQKCRPLEVISRVATYITSGTPDLPKPETPNRNEAHLEYLISLATALPSPIEGQFPSSADIQDVIDLLTTIHITVSAHHMMREVANASEDSPLNNIADQFRMERLHVRGDAFWPHLRSTMLDLLSPHDAMLHAVLGFTSSDFFRFMERTERLVNERFAAELDTHVRPYRALMKPWAHLASAEKAVSSREEAQFREFLEAHSDAVAAAKGKFDEFGTPSLFVIAAESVEEKAILAALSCSLGENRLFHGTKPEHRFWPLTESLTNRKPIIRHEGVHYAFHLPQIQRGAHTLISNLLREADPKYWKDKFLTSRDDYLERETASLFRGVLPNGKILTSMVYDVPEQHAQPDTDVVVICDDFLIIAECKAGSIEAASRRGARLSVKSDLDKTIVEAQSQAERLVRELTRRGELKLRPKGGGPETVIRVADFRWVARVSVTLDLMSPAATSLWLLKSAGLLQNAAKCWSASLNDLRVVMEMLDSPSLFLHYLIRRMDLNALRSVHAGDELDFLMHYVEHGLFFRDQNQPKSNEEITLSGFTQNLNQYYRRVEGISSFGKKPKVKLGRRTKRMLETLETLRPQHYITACLQMLEFDIPVREDLLGKLPGHLKTLRERSAAFGFSLAANYESKQGIALATAQRPADLREVVFGRAIEHCQEYGLEELCVILQGIPLGAPPVFVLLARPMDEPSGHAARLLRQLRFEIKELRTSRSDDSSAARRPAD